MNQLYLYVALIGLALVLYALTRTKGAAAVQTPERQAPAAAVDQELKDLLDDFMNDLDRDNVKLIDGFTKLQIEHKEQIAGQNGIIRALEQRVAELETKLEAKVSEFPKATVLPLSEEPISVPETEAVIEPARPMPAQEPVKPAFVMQEKYAHVLALSSLGKTPEQIARETGIGVGEILLVTGLAKRGES